MSEEAKDYSELDALVVEAKKAGIDPDVAAEWVDGLVDFNEVIPGPLGAAAEAVDGIVIKAAAKAAAKALKKISKKVLGILTDPEQRAARKAKRQAKKKERDARRAAAKAS